MNRILGFFKQKIIEVKQQNKQQLQTLANVLSQNQYSTDRVLTILQSMKANYMNWNILIANQASTGLYFSQLHNRNICLKKIKANKQLSKYTQKNKVKLQYIQDTAKQLKEINQLNGKWMNTVNTQIQGMNQYLKYQKRKIQDKLVKRQMQAEYKQVQSFKQEAYQQKGKENIKQQFKQQQLNIISEVKSQQNVVTKQSSMKVEQIQDDEQQQYS